MPRELTNLEIEQFLDRHPDIDSAVGITDDGGASGFDLSYPGDGVAVLDPSGRYVLVWKDASQRWHYIDLADMTQMQALAGSVNAPTYVSDPDWLTLIHEQLTTVFNTTGILATVAVIVLGGVLIGKVT